MDILLSNPRHSKYLYRPNKRGETPYKIDASLQKSILTTIFGQRTSFNVWYNKNPIVYLFVYIGTLNLNDDSILGYDLYSSALAEILSEPSLRTPITVVSTDPYSSYFDSHDLLLYRGFTQNGAVGNQHCLHI